MPLVCSNSPVNGDREMFAPKTNLENVVADSLSRINRI